MDDSQSVIKVPKFSKSNGFSTTEVRSKLMSKVKSKNTKPELLMRKALWNLGIRYRKHYNKLPGTPDIVLTKYKLVIFIDGEFWHGYDWGVRKNQIKSNREFWIPKIERNIQKDFADNKLLESMGYKVLRFGDRQIKKNIDECLGTVIKYAENYTLGTA